MVIDHSIIDKGVDISEGITDESILVLNTDDKEVLERYKKYNFKDIYYVDGSKIAFENIKRRIPNTSMLGALAGTGLVKIDSVEKAIYSVFGEKVGESNARAAREAYEQIKKA